MPRRTNPWPAFVDLFAALLIASFGGFIMLTGAYQQELSYSEEATQKLKNLQQQVATYQAAEDKIKKLRQEADRIFEQVRQSLSQDSSVPELRRCGEDTCIDLYIHFEKDKDEIFDSAERGKLEKICPVLKQALEKLPADYRKDIEVIIEGHTDSRLPEKVTDPVARYRYNWDLSARRATSVAYVFQTTCGLNPPDYQIVAIGYADSQPFPGCDRMKPECYDKNRRTTLRLRADTRRIESRLKEQTQSISR
jgi:flagellar motor protein MotB